MNLLINAGRDTDRPPVTTTTLARAILQSEVALPPFFDFGKYAPRRDPNSKRRVLSGALNTVAKKGTVAARELRPGRI